MLLGVSHVGDPLVELWVFDGQLVHRWTWVGPPGCVLLEFLCLHGLDSAIWEGVEVLPGGVLVEGGAPRELAEEGGRAGLEVLGHFVAPQVVSDALEASLD